MLIALALGLSATAAAQDGGFGAARLADGTPEFENCFNGSCGDDFFRFLSESMIEQGFAMQNHSLANSPLTNHRSGVIVGASAATFPFEEEPTNLSGKQENTSFSPVFPRISVGYNAEENYGVGVFFLPPIPVGGASALQLGAEGGYRFNDAGESGFGVEGDFTFLRARAAIVASQEQFDNAEAGGYENNLNPETFEENCSDEDGCIDTFSTYNVGIRAGYSWFIGNGLVPYVKGGVAVLNESLFVEYDETTWTLFAIQPSLHGGVAYQPGDNLHLALGASTALQQANQNEDDTIGLFYKLEGSVAWAF
ncbi:MAG: hypothetical protein AAFV53_09205 [Myxococcota bacterium]